MKNEKAYDATKSEVLKMLQELENEPQDSDPEADPADHVPFRKPVSIPKNEPVVPFVPVAPAARVAPIAPVAPVYRAAPVVPAVPVAPVAPVVVPSPPSAPCR